MEFTSIEKQAIVGLMLAIIESDGWIEDDEIEFSDEILDAIDCSEEDFDLGQEMPVLPALVTIKRMDDEKKDVVADIMATVIIADRVITEDELAIFDMVSELTGIRSIVDDLASEAD